MNHHSILCTKSAYLLVHVIAEDNCGNEDTTTFALTVRDCKKLHTLLLQWHRYSDHAFYRYD